VIPVFDVDRAKEFYERLGWRLDADVVDGDDFRVIQPSPPGSPCSIIFGAGITTAAPGSADGLYLVVDDIEAPRAELIEHGAQVSEVFHDAGGGHTSRLMRASRGSQISCAQRPERGGTARKSGRRRPLFDDLEKFLFAPNWLLARLAAQS
jgi:catechol 2,3-dioxygenase-like lactoylglutathione lyase family enzyme